MTLGTKRIFFVHTITDYTCWIDRSLGKGLSMSSSSLEECRLCVLTCNKVRQHKERFKTVKEQIQGAAKPVITDEQVIIILK